MFINPAFSLSRDALQKLHPTLTIPEIQHTLELVMQDTAFQGFLLDTFDGYAARIPDRLTHAPATPDPQNPLRLTLILAAIRKLNRRTTNHEGHTGIPVPLWENFIALAKPDQPPHYSTTPE